MIGSRTGARCGLVAGSRNGSGVDELGGGSAGNPMAGVAQDATSGKYMPANAAQWTTTLAAAGIVSGNPSNAWLCQDAATPLADAIGATGLDAANTVTFRNAVAGWSSLAAGVTVQAANGRFSSGAIGNVTTGSGLLLAYVATAASASDGSVCSLGSAGDLRVASIVVAGDYAAKGAGVTTATGAASVGATVRPVIIQVNRTVNSFSVITNQELITPTYVAPSANSAGVAFGAFGTVSSIDGVAAGSMFVMGAFFSGAAAEMSQANIRTLLQTLGWTVAW